MLRLANTGDTHLTEGPRFLDTARCLDFVVDDGIAQGVNLWLVGGDLSGTTVPHRATILERNTLAGLFQRMAEVGPVVVVGGNHDAPGDIAIYGRLSGRHPIIACETPQVVDVEGARVFAWPFAWKCDWRRDAGSMEAEDRVIEAAIRDTILGWRAQVDEAHGRGIPCVFVGHGPLRGAAIAGGEVLDPGREIELVADELAAVGFDYAGVSHIHLGQEMRSGIWLPGSPGRGSFGESDVKGYNVVDVQPGRPPIVHRRLTPARPFITVEARWSLDTGSGHPGWEWEQPACDGAEVRVRVTVPEEAAATCPAGDLETALRAAGAVDVKLERRTIPKQELRCAAIVEATSLEQQVRAFWGTLPDPPDAEQQARCLARLADYERGAVAHQEAA